jgi:hypothetical protein
MTPVDQPPDIGYSINPHYDQHVQEGAKAAFNHNTLAKEIVTRRSNYGSAWFDG